MGTTSDQDARTEAAWTDFELQFFVGADRLLGNIELTAGQTYDPDASTTLAADVDLQEEDTIYVASTTGFTTGILVIHPYAAGEAYEVLTYSGKTSNTFTGLERFGTENTREKLWHSSGATVSEWMDVTDYIYGNLSIDLNEDDEISDWSVKIQGHSYVSSLFQPDRAFLCMWRFRPYNGSMSSWTSWTVGFLGYMQDIIVSGTWEQKNTWTASVVSLGYYLEKTDVGEGTRFGRTDLAEDKSTEVSSELVDVYQEAGTGEFTGTPDLGGDKAVDADMGTLWISDGEPAPTTETPVANYGGTINEVYLRAEPWMPAGLQWIELFWKSTDSMWPTGFATYSLCTSYTTWQWAGWDPDARIPLNNFIVLPETPHIEIGDTWFGIVTNDKPAFMAHFPTCDADVYDWRGLQTGTFTMDPDGDALCLRWYGHETHDIIWWDGGRSSWALYDLVGGGNHYYAMGGTSYSGWTGSMIPTPPVGHTIRCEPTGNKGGAASYYEADEDHPTPGYVITGDPEWLIVDLGELGITLDAQLTIGYTAEAELTGTLGLTDGPAEVAIDSEIILYQSIDRLNNQIVGLSRGQHGTSDATHPEGSDVEQYEDGAATNNHLIDSIEWKRRPILTGVGTDLDVPMAFDIYSTIYSAGYPTPTDAEWDDGLGSGGWEDYWDRLASQRTYKQTRFMKTLTTPIRARKVMIAVKKMRGSGRVKINEFSVYAPSGAVLTGGEEYGVWEGGWSSRIVAFLLTTWLGVDEGNVTEEAMGRQVWQMDVVKDSLSRALRDISQSALTIVAFNLDNTITIRWNNLYSFGGWPDVYFYWDRDNARTITFTRKTQTAVAQVRMHITDVQAEESYEAVYPSKPFRIGEIVEREDHLLIGDEDDANTIAEALFNMKRLTDSVEIEPVGIGEWILPGQRHVVTYDIDGEDTYMSGHNIVVMGVTHTIKLGNADGSGKAWETQISARRVQYA